jgi:branched-chain amino acid transport system ATP-binding protein
MMLEVSGLVAGYGGAPAVNGVSLSVSEGEVVTVLGPNGAGKSTLLKVIAGVIHPMRGTVSLRGKPLPSKAHEILRMGLALVPEGRQVFSDLTVRENLEIASIVRKSERAAALEDAFQQFPILSEREAQLAGSLSGGEQEMLAIARALISQPTVLMMDEPSQGLAPLVVAQVFDIVKDLKARGHTVLLVEQNARMALGVSDRGYVMRQGRIVDSGSAGELLQEGRLAEAYLGTVAQ